MTRTFRYHSIVARSRRAAMARRAIAALAAVLAMLLATATGAAAVQTPSSGRDPAPVSITADDVADRVAAPSAPLDPAAGGGPVATPVVFGLGALVLLAVGVLAVLRGPAPARAPRSDVARRGGVAAAAPMVAVIALVVVEVTNAGTIGPQRAGVNLYLIALAIASAALVWGVVRGGLRPSWTPLYLLVAVYLATQLVSLVVTIDADVARADLVATLKDVVFLVVVTALLTATRHYDGVVRAAVIAVAALCGLSIANELFLDAPSAFGGFSQIPLAVDAGIPIARHSGPQADPNFWARSLLLFIPLALSLWAAARELRGTDVRHSTGWVWLLAAAAMVVALYLTQSRGALLSVALLGVAWLLLAGRGYRRLLLLSPAVLLVLLLVPGVGPRLLTLQSLTEARSAGGDPSLVERVAMQEVGLAIVAAHPALGVGPGNFNSAFDEFGSQSDVLPATQDGPYAPHNLYLELLSEGGVVGLAGWLVLYGGAALLALRAFILTPQGAPGDARPVRWLALGVAAGLLGWAAASVFLHLTHFRVLMVPLALAAVLDQRARAALPFAVHAPGWEQAVRRSRERRGAVAVAAATGCAVLVLGVAVVDVRTPVWESGHSAVVLPGGQVAGYEAYALDLLDRQPMMPTIATIVGSPRFEVEAAERLGLSARAQDEVDVGVAVSSQSTALTVIATSDDPRLAEDMSRAVLEGGRGYVNSLERLFVLTAPSPSRSAPVAAHRMRWGLLTSVLAASAAAAAAAYVVVSRGRPQVAP